MTEAALQLVEIGVGAIVVPWLAWVTVSIFNLRQQTAIMRSEMDLLAQIKDLVIDHLGSRK